MEEQGLFLSSWQKKNLLQSGNQICTSTYFALYKGKEDVIKPLSSALTNRKCEQNFQETLLNKLPLKKWIEKYKLHVLIKRVCTMDFPLKIEKFIRTFATILYLPLRDLSSNKKVTVCVVEF